MESKKFYNEVRTVLSGERLLGAWTSEKISPDERQHLELGARGNSRFILTIRSLPRGEDGTPCTEYILGPSSVVSAYLKAWETCAQGRISIAAYLAVVGALYGYPPEETAEWYIKNLNGAMCSCSQCLPSLAGKRKIYESPLLGEQNENPE